jgi:hypothetical protein
MRFQVAIRPDHFLKADFLVLIAPSHLDYFRIAD